MSKRIPQEELNKKLSYRFKQWFTGQDDTYVGILESKPQEEPKLSESVVRSHQRMKRSCFMTFTIPITIRRIRISSSSTELWLCYAAWRWL
jgi:hypothetical protein